MFASNQADMPGCHIKLETLLHVHFHNLTGAGEQIICLVHKRHLDMRFKCLSDTRTHFCRKGAAFERFTHVEPYECL